MTLAAAADRLSGVSLPLAFLAGLASFVSPCVLPLVPAYLAYLGARAGQPAAGAGVERAMVTAGGGMVVAGRGGLALGGADGGRAGLAASGLAFVAGLSLVFIAFFYALSTVVQPVREYVPMVAGVLVIVMALQVAGVLRIPFLMREFRVGGGTAPGRGGVAGGFLLGVSFASGWTPCIGATLGAVLSSAITQGTTPRGLLLMVVYCLGLGLPFVGIALGVGQARPIVRALNRHRRAIDLVSAAILLAMGLLLLTNQLTLLSSLFSRWLPSGFLDRVTL
ncbi:MAG TPA: cytochrome c biogenesis protein CcdA [Candidatus Dormibacteraeota bacterium]|nr:cytochrome c biogenesis protein CcdA [Candidatus Dormibacteraeota bacterium]